MKGLISTRGWLPYEENMVCPYNYVSMRGKGVTTRIVDNAIQLLFNGKKVAAKDYPDTKTIEDAEEMYKRIMNRLKLEHPHIVPFVKIQKIRHLLFMYIDEGDEEFR